MRLHSARLPRGAKVLAVGHHRRRDGAGRWRLDVLVDNLAIDAFAVTLAVGHVHVVVLIDVVVGVVAGGRLVNRAGVVVRVVRVDSAVVVAVDSLIDSAVAHIRIEIAVRVVRCAVAVVGVLIDVCHRARIDVRILVDVGHRPRILVDVGVCRCADIVVVVRVQRSAGVHVVIGVRRCAGRCVVIVIGIRVCAGGRIGVVRCAVRGRGIDVFRRRCGCGLCQYHRR